MRTRKRATSGTNGSPRAQSRLPGPRPASPARVQLLAWGGRASYSARRPQPAWGGTSGCLAGRELWNSHWLGKPAITAGRHATGPSCRRNSEPPSSRCRARSLPECPSTTECAVSPSIRCSPPRAVASARTKPDQRRAWPMGAPRGWLVLHRARSRCSRWCGRPGSNRHEPRGPTDFRTTSAFAAARLEEPGRSWSGLSLRPGPQATGAARLVSTPS